FEEQFPQVKGREVILYVGRINWVKNPKILEINTFPWLHSLSEIYSTSINLKNIPEQIFNQSFRFFDAVWLMGVWERSPASKRIALERSDLQEDFKRVLPDLRDIDVIGSPYAVYYYHIDNKIGGIDGLKEVREKLSEKNIRLVLDYVPNHVSIDSLWTFESDLFIKGTLDDLISHPYEYFSIGEKVFAYARDPNYPSWTDTIQINAFSKKARQKTINTILQIAEICDGVRCDMAMLMTNKVFSKTWGEKAGFTPERDFWEEIIPAIKKEHPNFIFIAEVYWGMEWELQQQGFDYCYDKRLYERFIHENVNAIKDHLKAEWGFQSKLIRFIENHDELRAIEKFGEKKSLAAAIIALTLPGARLVHDGQIYGYKIKLPVQLGRRPFEEKNETILNFYLNLLNAIPSQEFKNPNWSLCEVKPIDSDNSFINIISYLWWTDSRYRLIVVNFSPRYSKAHIKISPFHFDTYKWSFTDLLHKKTYSYNGEDLYKYGLYVELEAWKGHIFDIKKET
ncbi:MAG: alpha-amylase family glycosyl hydrolase, partial [Candidatus Odinarchaeota archaeon]